jgi:hypothetical protein
MDDSGWAQLIRSIKDGRCTPFLGAGISYGLVPLGANIAKDWADKHRYPMTDSDNLIKVAQFLAVESYPMFPKDELDRQIQEQKQTPDFRNAGQPHRILAELPLATYITTNYDDFMAQALKALPMPRDVKEEICRWNSLIKDRPSLFDEGYKPTPANPVVFHLHGHLGDPYSYVLTEDDYLAFLVNIAQDASIIPPAIQKALTQTSLLFIGYGLADWNFRVLLQTLTRFMEAGMRRQHWAVMLPPAGVSGEEQRTVDYWTKYYQRLNIRACWTTASDFLTELKRRWIAAQ